MDCCFFFSLLNISIFIGLSFFSLIQALIIEGANQETQPETKYDFLGDDPFYFEECDDHVKLVSK